MTLMSYESDDDDENPIDEGIAAAMYQGLDQRVSDREIEQIISWIIMIRKTAYLQGFNDGCRARS